MANKKITELPAAAAFTLDMLFETVFDPAGAPISQKATGTQVQAAFGISSPPFSDATALVNGSADVTKLLRFEVDGFTAGATRVATPPNQDFTIAGINVQQTFTQRQTITPPIDTEALVLSGFSATGASAASILDLSGTWNTSGAPKAFKLNITNTTSDATAQLMDLQVAGSTVFSVDINGFAVMNGGALLGSTLSIGSVFSVNGSTGLITLADGVRQIFNPDATNAGINVGAHAADPGTPVNGDLWYQSTSNELRARINGATVALGAGGGASPPFDDGTAIIKGSADATKLLRIEVDGFTTGNTRVATPPNQDFTIAGINVAQTFSVTQTFTPAANNRAINVSAATLSAASSLEFLRVAGTWNTSGTPSAMLVDITDVGSNAASKLADFQISSASVFSIGKTGLIGFADGVRQIFNPNGTNAGINVGAHTADPSAPVNGDLWYESTLNELHARINGATVVLGAGGGSAPFIDSTAIIKGSADATKLFRIEVDGFTTGTTRVATPPNQDFTMAGTNVAQTFTVEQTFTPASNTEAITVTGFSLTGANAQSILDLSGTWNTSGTPTAIKLNITNTASVGSFLIDLQTGGLSMFRVDALGPVYVSDTLSVGTGGAFFVNADGSFLMASGAFGVLVDGSFSATAGGFIVDSSSNLSLFSTITFNLSGFTVTDNGAQIAFSSPIMTGTIAISDDTGGYLEISSGSSLRVGVAAVSSVSIVADSYILVKDGTGTEYELLCKAH